jgi:hypothetical protein
MPTEDQAREAAQHRETLARFFSEWLLLRRQEKDLVAFAMTAPEAPLTEYARRKRVTRQAAHKRFAKLIRERPYIGRLLLTVRP